MIVDLPPSLSELCCSLDNCKERITTTLFAHTAENDGTNTNNLPTKHGIERSESRRFDSLDATLCQDS